MDNLGDPVPEDKFMKELEDLINRHNKDGEASAHDFVLAEYLVQSLAAFRYALNYERSVSGDTHNGQ